MSLKSCSVVFHESPKGDFKSGDTVSGIFNITQEKPKKLLDMTLEIIGEAKTHWKAKHMEGTTRKTENFGAHDIYFRTTPTNLTQGYPRKDKYITLKKGLSTFGFSAPLPQVLPSSFEGQFGNIKYYIKVTVRKDAKHDDSITFPFTVICKGDLYINPETSLPIKHELVKSFSFLGTKIGTLWIYFDLPMTGFFPKQQIPIDCYVNNQSKVMISHFVFSFERIVTYFSTFPCGSTRIETNKLVEQVSRGLHKEGEENFKVILIVPSVPPSSLYKNSVISIEYQIKVTVVLKGIYSNLKHTLPIVVKPSGDFPGPSATPFNGPSTSSSAPPEFDLICLDDHLPTSPPEYIDNSDLPTYEESQMTNKVMETFPDYPAAQTSQSPDCSINKKNPLD